MQHGVRPCSQFVLVEAEVTDRHQQRGQLVIRDFVGGVGRLLSQFLAHQSRVGSASTLAYSVSSGESPSSDGDDQYCFTPSNYWSDAFQLRMKKLHVSNSSLTLTFYLSVEFTSLV